MIYKYLFEDKDVKLQYHPRMYSSSGQLTKRYKNTIALQTAMLFVSKHLTYEYLSVLVHHSRIDVSRVFATRVVEKQDFLKTHVYPVVRRLRISKDYFHPLKCARALASLMSSLPRLELLELDILPDDKVFVTARDATPFFRDNGLTQEVLKAIQEDLQMAMVPYAEAMEVWRGLSNQFEIVGRYTATCLIQYQLWQPVVWNVTVNLKARSLVLTLMSPSGAVYKEKRIDMLPQENS